MEFRVNRAWSGKRRRQLHTRNSATGNPPLVASSSPGNAGVPPTVAGYPLARCDQHAGHPAFTAVSLSLHEHAMRDRLVKARWHMTPAWASVLSPDRAASSSGTTAPGTLSNGSNVRGSTWRSSWTRHILSSPSGTRGRTSMARTQRLRREIVWKTPGAPAS